MHQKIHKKLTVRGGVNAYGRSDRKISVFYAFPSLNPDLEFVQSVRGITQKNSLWVCIRLDYCTLTENLFEIDEEHLNFWPKMSQLTTFWLRLKIRESYCSIRFEKFHVWLNHDISQPCCLQILFEIWSNLSAACHQCTLTWRVGPNENQGGLGFVLIPLFVINIAFLLLLIYFKHTKSISLMVISITFDFVVLR